MSDAVLRLQDLHLRRGQRDILRGISFEAGRGELVTIMGPSGSGKTTILRAIAGLDPFHSGRVTVEDVVLEAEAPSGATLRRLRQKVGMVFQFHCLFEHLPALQNVWLAPVHSRGIRRDDAEQRARALLRTFGVEHRALALPRELSGGEAQRVAIARALAVDPRVLLMDEPTASLDPARRAELGDLLTGLASDGRSLVVATHDEEFARTFATRALRLVDGVVHEERGHV
jgi:ABC-type polar amino acid transport system ATPase subunit